MADEIINQIANIENLYWAWEKAKNAYNQSDILYDEIEVAGFETKFAFLSQGIIKSFIDKIITDLDVQEAIAAAIKESVMSYTRVKNTSIKIYNDFVSFIKDKYRINIPVEFPPTFPSEFDRQMYIVKELHEKGRDIAYFKDKLWISERTIEEDLSNLRSEEGVFILGQRVRVKGIERQNGNIEFKSTVHPIFLALNLTQVIVMLQGLKHMTEDGAYKEYALKLSANIWNELSDYARRRIKKITGMLSLDLSWYEELDRYRSNELFFTEQECSYEEGAGNILDFLKNGKECAIEFIDSNGESKILTNCIIKKFDPQRREIEVSSNGKPYTVNIVSIVKTREKAKHLY